MQKFLRTFSLMFTLLFAILAIAAVTQVDLTTQVKGILGSGNGGTNSQFFGVTGPTAARTYTFPDASATVLTSNAAVTVPQGGTGQSTLAAHGVVVGEGTTGVNVTTAGTSGNCLVSNGASADPTFQTCPGGAPNFAENETPSGTINGVNATFTLVNTPLTNALKLYKNGQRMTAGASADFVLTTNSIAFNSGAIPKTGDVLLADYRF